MVRRFYTTDVHGAYLPFKEVLDKVNFNYDIDLLIYGGDIVDGWPQSKECLDELMKIKNLIFILGNHDDWFLKYYSKTLNSNESISWLKYGGHDTLDSISEDKIDFYGKWLKSIIKPYYELNNMLFVHGGYDITKPIKFQIVDDLIWDRILVEKSFNHKDDILLKHKIEKLVQYSKVFFGHTPVSFFLDNYFEPILLFDKFLLCDTGSGSHGKVTLINIDTFENIQSENSKKYYPDYKGRNKFTFNQEIFGF